MTGHLSAGPRAVELDPRTGTLRMGEVEQRLDEATGSEAVFSAYLSLLYGVRGAQRGEELPLRSADLEALLRIVGEDPDYIEQRLVELMGCTVQEASLLKRLLLRHRALVATAGVATTLSVGALLGTAYAASDAPGATRPASSVTTPSQAPAETPPLEAWLTTDDGAHVPVPQGGDQQEPAAESVPAAEQPPVPQDVVPQDVAPQDRARQDPARQDPARQDLAPLPVVPAQRPAAAAAPQPVTPTSAPTPAPAAAATPTSAPAAAAAPTSAPAVAAPEGEVVLGQPQEPLDRPGSWIQPPQPGEDEVVLGKPQVLDRPGSWIQPPQPGEDEVVLGGLADSDPAAPAS